ncbi:MAG: hypothetical protein LBM98_05815 [Oscillospiraceae bacterium]|nr:hypothetical protein [Oscillospiraceae bacterium]
MLRTCNIVRIASVPVLRKDGARRRDVGRTGDASAHGAGNHPGATRCVPSQEGNLRGRAGLKPAPTKPRPNPRPIPLLGGVPPAGGGVVSPAGRNPRPIHRL